MGLVSAPFQLGWLIQLNASKRNWMLWRSAKRKFLNTAVCAPAYPGGEKAQESTNGLNS